MGFGANNEFEFTRELKEMLGKKVWFRANSGFTKDLVLLRKH